MKKRIKKIGICGFYNNGTELSDGQSIKTNVITNELMKEIGPDRIEIVDTANWEKSPLKLLLQCISLAVNCHNIIILPSINGVKLLVPLFVILNCFYRRTLFFIVIGGWLPEFLQKNHLVILFAKRLSYIYVETHVMLKKLKKLELCNVRYLPNTKGLTILNEKEIVYNFAEPYKLCTFSRVLKEKGIEDVILTVIKINKTLRREIFQLDIFGSIDSNYLNTFEDLIKNSPKYISYKGVIDYRKSVYVLKNYFALVFPTHYRTEGVPGTIIDSFAAGLPVISSSWDSAKEVVSNGKTGLLYEIQNNKELEKILYDVLNNPMCIINMKKNCLKEAEKYSPKSVITEIIKNLV